VIASRKSATAEESVALDPVSYETPGGPHASLEFFAPSPDGKFAVAGIAKGGSEVTTIYTRDLASGKDTAVSIDRIETAYNVPQWLPDSSGFLYCRRQKLPEGAPASDTYKNTITYLHKAGRPAEEDRPIFGKDLAPEIKFEPMDFPSVWVFPGSEYVIGQIHHGDSQELTLYSARLDALGEKTIPWKKICGIPDGVIEFGAHGNHAYVVTS
jgi:prolyl oligopeptidase